jgi:hypothetical protein
MVGQADAQIVDMSAKSVKCHSFTNKVALSYVFLSRLLGYFAIIEMTIDRITIKPSMIKTICWARMERWSRLDVEPFFAIFQSP